MQDGRLPVLTIDPLVEQAMGEVLRPGEHGSFLALDPDTVERFSTDLARKIEDVEQTGV